MLITYKYTPFYKKLDCDTKSEPPYLATTLKYTFAKLLHLILGFIFGVWVLYYIFTQLMLFSIIWNK
jgi:hypothetical protein